MKFEAIRAQRMECNVAWMCRRLQIRLMASMSQMPADANATRIKSGISVGQRLTKMVSIGCSDVASG